MDVLERLDEEHVELVVAHMEFTRALSRQFYRKKSHFGFDQEDFEGAAMLGLCDAARRFDREKGMHFKTFAYFRIRGAMYDLLRNGTGISRTQYRDLIRAPQQASSEQGRTDTPSLPYAFARSADELMNLLDVLDSVNMKLYQGCDGSMELTYAVAHTPEDVVVIDNTKRYVARLLAQLPERERKIIELRYFEGATFDQIGQALGGISKSWISRQHGVALESLRAMIQNETRDCERRTASHAA